MQLLRIDLNREREGKKSFMCKINSSERKKILVGLIQLVFIVKSVAIGTVTPVNVEINLDLGCIYDWNWADVI